MHRAIVFFGAVIAVSLGECDMRATTSAGSPPDDDGALNLSDQTHVLVEPAARIWLLRSRVAGRSVEAMRGDRSRLREWSVANP